MSYKENYEYLRADKLPVSEKTDAPDGLNCYSPSEFQSKLDELDGPARFGSASPRIQFFDSSTAKIQQVFSSICEVISVNLYAFT